MSLLRLLTLERAGRRDLFPDLIKNENCLQVLVISAESCEVLLEWLSKYRRNNMDESFENYFSEAFVLFLRLNKKLIIKYI